MDHHHGAHNPPASPEQIERRFGKVGNTLPKLTFDKDRIIGYSDIEFVGPGHPLFETVWSGC